MEYEHVTINDEWGGVEILLPSGETLEVTFNGSDPVVYLVSLNGEERTELVPA